MNTNRRHRTLSRQVLTAVAVALVISLLPHAVAQAQNDICFPAVGGLAGVPNVTDGVVEGYTGPGATNNDPGWNGATRINLSADLGVTTAAKFQAGRAGGFVYFSFVVDTPTPGSDDHLVLALSTDGNDAHDWRIHIKPFDVGIVDGASQSPNAVIFWRNSGTWNGGGAGTAVGPGHWLHDNTRFAKGGSRWSLEMRIPINTLANAGLDTGIYFPNPGTFQLYVNILSTSSLIGMFSQDPWPADKLIMGPGFLTQKTPAKPWGTASFNDRPACSGVSLSWSDIGVDSPVMPGTIIQEIRRFDPAGPGTFTETEAQCQALPENHLFPASVGPLNTFVARPVNGMTNNAQVSVNFRIANWGIPGVSEWQPIGQVSPPPPPPLGVAGNPTAQTLIAPGLSGNFTATWQLTYRWSCLYFHTPHQCIMVEMDSNDPNTRFKNKSVQKNMDFVPASLFRRTAYISGKQGPSPPGQPRRFVLIVETDEQGTLRKPNPKNQLSTGTSSATLDPKGSRKLRSDELARLAALQFRQQYSNLAVWIARGYLRTGTKLNINGTEYDYAKRVGDFGYVAAHRGPIEGWRYALSGHDLRKPNDRVEVYTIDVPPDGEAEVTTEIEAIEAGSPPGSDRFALSLHAGIDIPHGNFGSVLGSGFSFGADLEYRVTNQFSLEGLYGFNRSSGILSGPDTNVHNFSLNGKVYAVPGAVRPFFNFGGGAYNFDPGPTEFGLNFGTGLQFNVQSNVALEAAYNFHNVFTSGSNTRFSTVQGGVRFRF